VKVAAGTYYNCVRRVSAFRKYGKYRNTVFALFAPPRGSQDRVVGNVGLLVFFEFCSNVLAQACVGFGGLARDATGIFVDHPSRAFVLLVASCVEP
jgi:hypothetical protein